MTLRFFNDSELEYRGKFVSTEIWEWFKSSQLPINRNHLFQTLLLGMILNQFHPHNQSP
jgi:hypothetical protein